MKECMSRGSVIVMEKNAKEAAKWITTAQRKRRKEWAW